MVRREAISQYAGQPGNPDCDEARIRADERRLHLAEQMHVVAAHRQHVAASFQVNLSGFIVMSLDMADRTQIHDDRPMDLCELVGIELVEQVFQRRPDHRLGRFPSVAPGDSVYFVSDRR